MYERFVRVASCFTCHKQKQATAQRTDLYSMVPQFARADNISCFNNARHISWSAHRWIMRHMFSSLFCNEPWSQQEHYSANNKLLCITSLIEQYLFHVDWLDFDREFKSLCIWKTVAYLSKISKFCVLKNRHMQSQVLILVVYSQKKLKELSIFNNNKS